MAIAQRLNRLRAAAPLALALMLIAGGGLLVFAAYVKATDIGAFTLAVVRHGIVPTGIAPSLALGFVILEIIVGALVVFLVLGPGKGRAATLALSVFFAALAGYSLIVALHPPAKPAPCGCGLWMAPVNDWRVLVVQNSTVSAIFAGAWFVVPHRIGRPRRPG